jgi:hypothetical protein
VRRTVHELADALGIEDDAAKALVKFLLACEPPLAKFRGERASEYGRGAHVYEIEHGAGVMVRRMIERVET